MKTITKILAIFIAFAAISGCASSQPATSDNDFGFGGSTASTQKKTATQKTNTKDADKIKALEEKIAQLESAQKSGGNEKSEKSEKHLHFSLFGGGGGYATGVTTGVNYNIPTNGYNTGYQQPMAQTAVLQTNTALNGFAIITHTSCFNQNNHSCRLEAVIGYQSLGRDAYGNPIKGQAVWKTTCGGKFPDIGYIPF